MRGGIDRDRGNKSVPACAAYLHAQILQRVVIVLESHDLEVQVKQVHEAVRGEHVAAGGDGGWTMGVVISRRARAAERGKRRSGVGRNAVPAGLGLNVHVGHGTRAREVLVVG